MFKRIGIVVFVIVCLMGLYTACKKYQEFRFVKQVLLANEKEGFQFTKGQFGWADLVCHLDDSGTQVILWETKPEGQRVAFYEPKKGKLSAQILWEGQPNDSIDTWAFQEVKDPTSGTPYLQVENNLFTHGAEAQGPQETSATLYSYQAATGLRKVLQYQSFLSGGANYNCESRLEFAAKDKLVIHYAGSAGDRKFSFDHVYQLDPATGLAAQVSGEPFEHFFKPVQVK
jgi:hypothetical protein